jgi:UDP-N-acetylmuramyl pentapeptide phosphotransferase/UDP-N-acetylglucosamine-1-phosphate transferase
MRWSEPGGLLAIALVAGLLSWAATRWAIRHAHARGLHDLPGERRSHAVPTPRGGGIGIALAGLGALLLLAAVDATPVGWLAMALGLALVAGIGWWDDHRPLPAWPRLLVHFVAASLLAFGLHAQGSDWLAVSGGFVLGLGLVNAWNFMDGINGMAVVQAIVAGAALSWMVGGDAAVVAVALAAAALAFLPSNFPVARVFLGDVGSGAIGYLVAVLMAIGLGRQPLAYWPMILLPGVAMIDAVLTLGARMLRAERWWEPHATHAYQRWARRVGHSRVSLAYGGWTMLAVATIMSVSEARAGWAWYAFTAWVVASLLAWRFILGWSGRTDTEGFGT